MSRLNPEGWVWSKNEPSFKTRIAVSITVATLASSLVVIGFLLNPGQHYDFGPAWFGARTLFTGGDPYELIGPGREFDWSWRMTYPGTAILSAVPFAIFAVESAATTAFVFLSTSALVFGSTRDSWHRMPAFVSLPFIVSSAAGQWSSLLAASWFLPWLSVFWAAKPTVGLSLIVATRKRSTLLLGAITSTLAIALSLLLMPGWPTDWLSIVTSSRDFHSPILWPGGFVIPLAMLRYRQPEAWFLVALALVPQSAGIYDLLLILMIVPRTYREACVLSISATIGGFLFNLVPTDSPELWMMTRGMLVVASGYLPATAIILRRSAKRREEVVA